MTTDKKIILVGIALFIMACLFPYRTFNTYYYSKNGGYAREDFIDCPDGFYFITFLDKTCTERCQRGWGCEKGYWEYSRKAQIVYEVLALELAIIIFGTLGALLLFGKKKKE